MKARNELPGPDRTMGVGKANVAAKENASSYNVIKVTTVLLWKMKVLQQIFFQKKSDSWTVTFVKEEKKTSGLGIPVKTEFWRCNSIIARCNYYHRNYRLQHAGYMTHRFGLGSVAILGRGASILTTTPHTFAPKTAAKQPQQHQQEQEQEQHHQQSQNRCRRHKTLHPSFAGRTVHNNNRKDGKCISSHGPERRWRWLSGRKPCSARCCLLVDVDACCILSRASLPTNQKKNIAGKILLKQMQI